MRREIDLFNFVKQKISLVCAVKVGDRPQWVATGATIYVKTRNKKGSNNCIICRKQIIFVASTFLK
jgi:hypothetical protein